MTSAARLLISNCYTLSDPTTFRIWNGGMGMRELDVDKNNVFCGDLKASDMLIQQNGCWLIFQDK